MTIWEAATMNHPTLWERIRDMFTPRTEQLEQLHHEQVRHARERADLDQQMQDREREVLRLEVSLIRRQQQTGARS